MKFKYLYHYLYYVPEYSEGPEDARSFKSVHSGTDSWEYKWVTEAICDQLFPDSWDYVCPEFIMLKRENENVWHRISIEVELVPSFSCWEVV